MPFEWQEREQAAQTLGVEAERLQAWIDSGQAPSRKHNGRVEVLIEFPEEEGDDEGRDGSDAHGSGGDAEAESAPTAERIEPAEAAAPGEPRTATHHQLEVISRRELQMAAGTVAAWQRVAETAEHELHRSRRLGTLAWSLIAAFVVAGGAGIWWATYNIIETRAAAEFAQARLARAAEDSDAARDRLRRLEERTERLAGELHETRQGLAAARERAALAEARNQQLVEQQRMTTDLAESRAESHHSLVITLEAAAEDQRRRIAELEAALADARERLDTAREELDTTRRQLAEADE